MLISFIKKSQFYFIFSFLALIAIGTLLLRLPILKGGRQLEWIDALFTATSAVCVTGLVTVDLTSFSLFGQMVVMLLIQLGGIGIMTMSGSIFVIMGKNMSWGEMKMLSSMTDDYSPNGIEIMMRTIIAYTMIVETLGMLLLIIAFMLDDFSFIDSLWNSLFISVAAFCNAGMSPLKGNLENVSGMVKIIVALMVILGGIGMYVVYDIRESFKFNRTMRINSKLILITTFMLIIVGTLLLKFYQYRNGNAISWLDAFFQAVSARTAGFNTIPMDIISSGGILILCFLMLIGGAPGSTAGGMKVTTFALVMAALYNTFSGNEKVLIFKRKIATGTVLKAFTIAVTFIVLSAVGAGIFQGLTKAPMQKAAFEVISALGTVGMSLGMGENYTENGKLFIIFYMFIGRIGPLTLLAFLLGREKKSKLLYPEEKVIIG